MTFTVHSTSNIDAVIAAVEKNLAQAAAPVIGEVVNTAEYARYLHDKVAYWVMNDDILADYWREEVEKEIAAANRAGEIFGDKHHHRAAFNALRRTVERYKATIGTTDRPGKVMLPPRPLHEGNYADDSVNLVRSYVTYIRQAGRVVDFTTYKEYDG